MKKVYRIGKFRFFTYEEYEKGLEDVKKIKYITDEVDTADPDAILRLYTLIRKKEIRFQTQIGEDYLLYLSDIVADNTRDMMYQTPQYVKDVSEDGRSKLRMIAGILCLVGAAVTFAMFANAEYKQYRETKHIKELQELRGNQGPVDISKAEIGQSSVDFPKDADNNSDASQGQEKKKDKKSETKVKVPPVLAEYQGVYEQNPETIGWLKIADTQIDYPIMQSKESAKDFYLDHNFAGEEDANGTLFISNESNVIDRDTNVTIYGHNMKSGLMFGELKNYLDREYYDAHKTIEFDTIYEKGIYEVIAVCLGEVKYQDEDIFKYYETQQLESKNAFKAYKANIMRLSVYGGEVDMVYGDQLLTLSTCNNYTEDGRLFLLAKKVG